MKRLTLTALFLAVCGAACLTGCAHKSAETPSVRNAAAPPSDDQAAPQTASVSQGTLRQQKKGD